MRYAIYYAPASGSLLHRLGSIWLGRDVFDGADRAQPGDGSLAELTDEPRRYGFHATLKPPFALRDGVGRAALGDAVALLASALDCVEIGGIELRRIDGFLALVPAGDTAAADGLAATCVRELDDFREPPGEVELQRRRATGLTHSQERNLQDWGYPYVLGDFRFHMSLTRRLLQEEAAVAEPLARAHFAGTLAKPLTIDALTIFREAAPGMPFEAEERFPLRQSAMKVA